MPGSGERFSFGRFVVLDQQRQLLVDGNPAVIGARAFDVLLALIRHHQRIVGKSELLDLVWPDLIVEENNLQVQISTLRKVLGPQAIVTIPGRGYKFALPVRRDGGDESVSAAASAQTLPRETLASGHGRGSEGAAVAVLPFDNFGSGADQEYLSDGICEDLLTSLAMWREFPVISRNSSFAYRNRGADLKAVADELGAGYLVVGGLRRAGQRLRITTQLLNPENGHQIWAGGWNTNLQDVFETQTQIAHAIAVALRPELLKAESDRAIRQPPSDMGARDFALRGLWHLYRGDPDSGQQAIALLTQAVELDPNSGFAHAHLAHAYYASIIHQWSSQPLLAVQKVTEHAGRAVVCDPLDANGHLYWGLSCSVRGLFKERTAALLRAVELNPSLPLAHSLLGQFLGSEGHTEEGLAHIDRAVELSPRDPALWSFYGGKAAILFVAKRYAESMAAARKGLSINPDAGNLYSNIAASSALLGDIEQAAQALREMRRVWPDVSIEKLRIALASAPAEVTERFFAGLRSAGFEAGVSS
jgi:TolB-like protein